MRGKKKWIFICVGIMFLFSLSARVYAAGELKDNDLEIKVERLERGTAASDNTIINNEDLFYERANEKIKEYKEKEDAEKLKTKETLFTQGTINVNIYETTTVFRDEVSQKYTQVTGAVTAGENKQNMEVLVYAIGCLIIIVIGSVTSYKLYKKG